MPEPLIYQALEAFMEIYEDMWKYVECDDSQFHFLLPPARIYGILSILNNEIYTITLLLN